MRPIFIIYLAAGITLFFAVINSASYLGRAYMTDHAIVSLKLDSDDLARMQAAQSEEFDSASAGFVIAVLQIAILISTRRFQKREGAHNYSPKPSTLDVPNSASRSTRKASS